MSQQGFLMKRSGGKFTGSSYGNRNNKLDRRWFRIREGSLYYYKQSSEMKESTHHAGKVALEGTQVLAGGDGVTFALVTSSRILTMVADDEASRHAWMGALLAAGAASGRGDAEEESARMEEHDDDESSGYAGASEKSDAGGDGDVDSLVPALEKKLSLITAGSPCPNCGDARALVVNQQSGMWECNRCGSIGKITERSKKQSQLLQHSRTSL